MKVTLHQTIAGLLSTALLLVLVPATSVFAEETPVPDTQPVVAAAQEQAATTPELWIGDIDGLDPSGWQGEDQYVVFQVKASYDVTVTVSKDGGEPEELYPGDSGYTLVVTGAGNYKITAKEEDGRKVEYVISVSGGQTSAPKLTIVGDTATHKSSDVIKIEPDVGSSSIAAIEVKVDSGEWEKLSLSTYQDGYKVTANGTYSFRVTNSAQATSEVQTLVYTNITPTDGGDTVAPTLTLKGNVTDSKTSDVVGIQVSVGTLGVAKVEVQKDGGEWADITATYQNGYEVKANGTYSFRVTNSAGAVSATAQIVYANINPNKLEIQGVYNGKIYYVDQVVTVSGGSSAVLTVNGEAFQSGGTLPGNKDATYVIKATAANGETVSCTITMATIASVLGNLSTATVDTVLPDQKVALEAVLATLKQIDTAHATDAQKAEVSTALQQIEGCVGLLTHVKDLETRVASLPTSIDGISSAVGQSMEECQALFRNLSNHGKEIFDATLKTKLGTLTGQLTPSSYKDLVSGSTVSLTDSTIAFPAGTQVSVKSVTDSAELKRLQDAIKATQGTTAHQSIVWISGNVAVNGVKGQLPGAAQITIPRSSLVNFDASAYTDLKVGHLKDDGTFELLPCTLTDTQLQFVTGSFSHFVLLGVSVAPAATPVPTATPTATPTLSRVPQTGDNNSLGAFLLLSLGTLVCVTIVRKKRSTNV